MTPIKGFVLFALVFLTGYLIGEFRESLFLNRVLSKWIKKADLENYEYPETGLKEAAINPTSSKLSSELYEQKCLNKETGWDALNTLILKNNTIYNVIKDHPLELDLWSWDSFEKYINVLLPEVAKSSKSDTIKVIEVGSFKGKSAFDHATKCREITQKFNKKCIVISVDTWLGSMEHYEDPKYALKVAEDYATK